jgi:hypothetical protein
VVVALPPDEAADVNSVLLPNLAVGPSGCSTRPPLRLMTVPLPPDEDADVNSRLLPTFDAVAKC